MKDGAIGKFLHNLHHQPLKEPVVILGPKRCAQALKARWHDSGNLRLPDLESANERLVCALGVKRQPEEVKTG